MPATTGRIFFVAPSASYTVEGRTYVASDDNDGLSPERAVVTIQRAIDLSTASVGDVISLLEGTHTLTALLNVNKAGLRILGPHGEGGKINPYKPRAIIATSASADLINITVDNTEIGYVTLRPASGYDAVTFKTSSAISGVYIHDFYGDLNTPAVSTETRIINFTHRGTGSGGSFEAIGVSGAGSPTAITNVLIEDGVFESDGAQGPAIEFATVYATVRRSKFFNTAGTWAIPVRVATDTDNTLMEDCVWYTSGTMGQGVDGTDAGVTDGTYFRRCEFPRNLTSISKALDGFSTNTAMMSQCYIMTATGASTVIIVT